MFLYETINSSTFSFCDDGAVFVFGVIIAVVVVVACVYVEGTILLYLFFVSDAIPFGGRSVP